MVQQLQDQVDVAEPGQRLDLADQVLGGAFGVAGVKESASGFTHDNLTLVLNDLVLREDIDRGWREKWRVAKKDDWELSKEVPPRPKVRIGGYSKPSQFRDKILGFADLVEHFYTKSWADQISRLVSP